MNNRGMMMQWGAALAMALSACAPPLVGVEPRLSSDERDERQRAMPRPSLEAEDAYESVAREIDVPVPFTALSAWLQSSEIRGLQSFSVGTVRVARLERVEALTGTWSRVGDRRRAVFADGNTAVQELVYVGPDGVEYVEWNLTNDAGRYLRHVRHRVALTALGASTRVRWVSAFRPRPFPDGLLIRSYVRDDYTDYLRATLTAMRQRAVVDFANASTPTTSR
jgi:hypothetical protein